ncbi:MAG: hypothetical protein R3F65_33590, partial [bacterium]
MRDDYEHDIAMILEQDQEDMDRLEEVAAAMEADEEELGAVLPQFQALARKLGPRGAAVAKPLKRARANRARFSQLVKRLKRRKPARVQACKTYTVPRRQPITAKDIAGRVSTPTPLYAVVSFKQGALSTSIRGMSGQNVRSVKMFHKGIDDDGGAYGIDTPIDRHRTNLITGGALPDGHTFIGHGIEIEVQAVDRSEVNVSDLRILGDALVRWGDRN